jgi:hypothetical protein
MRQYLFHVIIFSAFVLLFGSCSKQFTDEPKANVPPSTRLWLTPESDLRETFSRQHFYWYGEDLDGRVVGYLLAVGNFKPAPISLQLPDTLTYTWVTRSDTLIALPLRTLQDSFVVIVRAVDNTFKAASLLPVGASVRMTPQPYWDVETNKIYGGGDMALNGLESAADPKGAILLFPIRNTPPTVGFAVNPVDTSVVIQQPETTYTVATFSWVGHDADGDQTITGYRIALNDTSVSSNWFTLTGSPIVVTLAVPRSVSDQATTNTVRASVYTGTFTSLQLRGTIPGLKLDAANVLYLQAKDLAGEYSKAARMPTLTNRTWFVKKPRGTMLVIKDYNQADASTAVETYQSAFSTVSIGGSSLGSFDILDVGYGLSASDKQTQTLNQKYGNLVPSNLNPAFILTLQLYKLVYWFSDLYPSYTPARIGLFNYIQRGGKAIFSTTFPANISFPDVQALNDFAPIDSVSSDPESKSSGSDTLRTHAGNILPVGTRVLPYDATSGYPALTFGPSSTGGKYRNLNWREIYKRADASYIYELERSTDNRDPYLGTPTVAVIDNAKTFVLVALPVHLLNGNTTALTAFFRKVIVDEFGLQ